MNDFHFNTVTFTITVTDLRIPCIIFALSLTKILSKSLAAWSLGSVGIVTNVAVAIVIHHGMKVVEGRALG